MTWLLRIGGGIIWLNIIFFVLAQLVTNENKWAKVFTLLTIAAWMGIWVWLCLNFQILFRSGVIGR